MKIFQQTTTLLIMLALAAGFGGCAETKRATEVTVKESGFLQDYSRLQSGREGEALLRYRNPDADFKTYDKIIIYPVQIFKPKDASKEEMKDLQKLAGHFNTYLARELGKDYQVVQTPAPGTLEVEAAITGADKSGRTMDLISTVMPVGWVVSGGKDFATGKPTGVGDVSAEMRITDAATGQVLAEAVDRRVGGKAPSGMFDSWHDADRAMQYWAKRLAYVLCTERGGTGCTKP